MSLSSSKLQPAAGRSDYILECCTDSTASALAAHRGGADRLELCSNLIIGGTTPTLSLFESIREQCDIRIHILIRPRFGDFLYSEDEIRIMEKDIARFRKAGADGVVIGALNPDGTLNPEALKRLIGQAEGMHLTLHRAFDMCKDAEEALETACTLGFDTILTSGQKNCCTDGIPLLNELQTQAADRLTIMAGAGVNASVIERLLTETSLHAFHMSGKKVINSAMTYRNPSVSMGLPGFDEYSLWQTDEEAIRTARKVLS
ncbi:MAG: copper homeostasis protein CutC [Lachnospiraceae bacterium]|nr:copper homeostasis protein CutC [Lachnospiraceae bacterium]